MSSIRLRGEYIKHRQGLTDRELEVITLVAEDLCNKTIARKLHLEVQTVKTHIKHANVKLGTRSRVGLTLWFIRKQNRRYLN